MREWLRTGEVASMLGTSTTTVRNMARRGDLDYEVLPRTSRSVWRISAESVARYRAGTTCDSPRVDPGHEASALHDQIEDLRAVVARLQDRNDLVLAAHGRQVRAAGLLARAVEESLAASDELRRALEAQDQALTQTLTPGAAEIVRPS